MEIKTKKNVIELHTLNGSTTKTPFSVEKTTDYDKFKPLVGNRAKNKAHIARLKKSFESAYLLSPILVNEKFQIIDGQHRFEAAKELHYPIFYIVVPGYGNNEVQVLNTNSVNWNRTDFLQAYCEMKYPAYLSLRNFMRQFPEFGIQSALLLITGKNTKASQIVMNGVTVRKKDFEEGKLVLGDITYAENCAKKILDMKPYYKGFHKLKFVGAMLQIFKNPNYKQKEFLEKLDKRPTVLQDCVTIEAYKLHIEDIYNYRRQDKVSIRF